MHSASGWALEGWLVFRKDAHFSVASLKGRWKIQADLEPPSLILLKVLILPRTRCLRRVPSLLLFLPAFGEHHQVLAQAA